MPLTAEQQLYLNALQSGYGTVSGALGLIDPNASPAGKASGGVSALGGASSLSGALGGPTIPGGALGALGGAAGAAGLGYNISQIAGDPRLSTKQKIGSSALAATDAAQLLIPYYGPIYGATLAVDALGNQLEKSGSPQLRSTGRALTAPLLPIEGFRNVISGRQSPRAAANQTIANMRQVPILSKIYNPILDILGLGTPPTTGTMLRDESARLAKQIPELKGFKMEHDALTPEEYNAYNAASKNAAYDMATAMGTYLPDYKKDPKAYQIQLGNSLLKHYGDGIVDMWKKLQPVFAPPTTTRVAST